ncbi:hypothetical protein RhiirC2_739542 [Rhizophagus irregularis]|uniref:Uncharacterized protein n=1 Tax=Rhizophagus irregularis TaxID=588596 RepID=A0A2N1NJN1_9GLOM|nr:hypothetical protein RhiirC2_739542 [Rhizophagus irregularis]
MTYMNELIDQNVRTGYVESHEIIFRIFDILISIIIKTILFFRKKNRNLINWKIKITK